VNKTMRRAKAVGFIDSSLCSAQVALWNGSVSAELLFPYLERMDDAGFDAIDILSPELASCIVQRNENPLEVLRAGAARLQKTPANVWISARCLLGSAPMEQDLLELGIATLAKCGARRMTCFDALNDVTAIERIVASCRATGIEIAAALVYSRSPFHDDRYYAERAGYLARLGISSVVVVDLVGSISPGTTRNLVSAARVASGSLPIEFKTQCRSGVAEMSCFEAVSCEADVLHTATETLSGGWSLPSAGYFVEHFSRWHTPVGLDHAIIAKMDEYFLALAKAHNLPRGRHALPDPSAERYQIPVALLARLAAAAGTLGVSIDSLLEECRLVQQELGWPTLAHPIGAIVMEQAILNITTGERFAAIRPELGAYLEGEHGSPPGAVDADLRARSAETCAQAATGEAAVRDAEQRLLSYWFPDRDVTCLKLVTPVPVRGATPEQYLKEQLEKFPTLRSIRVCKGEFIFNLNRGTK
jgi:oxaloacetate decarboxylase (Na+ extruding) subunit alpha